MKLPPLELPRWPARVSFTAVMVTPVGVAVVLGHWIGLCSVVPLCALSFLVSRPWCVAFPIGLRTVGELGLCLTSYAEHRGSGYRWTRNEVAMKVRMIVAGSLALRLDEVRPETTWAELLGAD